MYLCKCLLEFGDDVCNSYTIVSHELCYVGWDEFKSKVQEIIFYTSFPSYEPKNKHIFCCFDCASDVIFHLNIKKIFFNFLKADENSSEGCSREVKLDEEKESLSLENFLKLNTSNEYNSFSIVQSLYSFNKKDGC